MPRPIALPARRVALLACLAAAGCDEAALREVAATGAAAPSGFDAHQAAVVVARVGSETITVGDVARRLEAMSTAERTRYGDATARRDLAAQMIDEALLEAEARRRGLEDRPEIREAIDAALREAMKAEAHAALPDPAAIPEADLRAFYEQNRALWVVPERRLPSVVVFDDHALATAALDRHRDGVDDASWNELVAAHGGADGPHGDLAHVGPPDDPQGAKDAVPEPVRAAVYSIAELGQLAAAPVEHDGRFYLVRYRGRTAAQARPFSDVRAGVLSLYLKRARERVEAEQLAELRRRFGVRVDEGALEAVQAPAGFDAYVPYWQKR